YENPTPFSNLVEMISILLIGAGLVFSFGRMIRDNRQGRALFLAMGIVLVAGIGVCYWAESQGNPLFTPAGVDMTSSDVSPGGNMEGKEVRFGIANSAAWAASTTATSNGSVNAMLDSFTPIGGMVPLFNLMLSEVIFGGIGSGLHGMIVYVIITVFI